MCQSLIFYFNMECIDESLRHLCVLRLEFSPILTRSWTTLAPQTFHCWYVCLSVCLFVWVFSFHSRIFHSPPMLGSEGSLACHTYCDTWHPFIMVISGDPWHSRLLLSVSQFWMYRLYPVTIQNDRPMPCLDSHISLISTQCTREVDLSGIS